MPKKPRLLKCGPNKVKGKFEGSIYAKDLATCLRKASKEISAAYVKAEGDLTNVLCPDECPYDRPRPLTGTWTGAIKISAGRGQRCRITWSIRGEAKVNCLSRIRGLTTIPSSIRQSPALASGRKRI